MPAPSNTQQRRREISDALARVMARSGYDGASVAAIAAEAGVAAGGVHYHFESKGEILVDLVERLVATAEKRIDARVVRADGPRERLGAVLDGLLGLGDDAAPEAVAVWALIGAEAVRNDEVQGLYAQWLDQARETLVNAFGQACLAEGKKVSGAAQAASALLALVEGYYAIAAGAPRLIPRGSAAPLGREIAFALLDRQPEMRQ